MTGRSSMRAAAIDIGTNTVLLLVAERAADGSLCALAERATITRLGEGVDRAHRLSPPAIARTLECLEQYAAIVRDLGVERVGVVGTSAMRDALGAEQVRQHVRTLLGVDARVLSGLEEARLMFSGALSDLAIGAKRNVAVFDVGGGSTEVVIGRIEAGTAHVVFSASYDVGSVRLTERYVRHDPPTTVEQEALRGAAQRAFVGVPPLPDESDPVGVAGTMTTLAAVSLGLEPYDGSRVHGQTLELRELRSVVKRLTRIDLETRKRLPGMEPNRADVIIGGAIVALALLEQWGASRVRISDRGVRWGLAKELLAQLV